MRGAKLNFRRVALALVLCLSVGLTWGCRPDDDDDDDPSVPTIVVNSLEDPAVPAPGVMTLRRAVDEIPSGGRIVFHRSLNGGTILLGIVGEEHSVLPAETYAAGVFAGYADRDYGRSALYAVKDLMIDASSLPDGIGIKWTGGDLNPARVLAVYGDLTLRKVWVSSGLARYEATSDPDQPYTLGRGGALAVWGAATLERCVLSGNRAEGDPNASRDRGAFGGGVYAKVVVLRDSVVGGNRALGYGAAGGGVYSVGGPSPTDPESRIVRSTISGNRVTAQHAYGGGVFSEGGGPGNRKTIHLENCTLTDNLAEDNPAIDQTSPTPPPPQYYYRGGGLYMTNGSAEFISCTIVGNEVRGYPAVFSGKPNLGGGGVAATIGNAHVVELMTFRHSIVAGNLVNGESDDVFSGSLLHFYSQGYNRFGKLNFDYILVPIPAWQSLSRKHYPGRGDEDGVAAGRAVDLADFESNPLIASAGVEEGEDLLLWYRPGPASLDVIPSAPYRQDYVLAGYAVAPGGTDDFLARILEVLRVDYGFGPTFGAGLNYVGVTWQGTDGTWPSDPLNADWIKFWRDLDAELGDTLGAVRLGDEFWGGLKDGVGGDILFEFDGESVRVGLAAIDQLRRPRPQGGKGDIGAIEQ